MSYSHLSSEERRVIFHCFMYGVTRAEIARRLGRHRSTISREIKRGARRYGPGYDGIYAHEQALAKRRTARHRRRVDNAPLVRYVEQKLRAHWPPEAIAGRLPIAFPNRADMRISHEQIYRWIYADSRDRGVLRRYLRRGHVHRRRRRRLSALRARFPDRVDIDQRPTAVDRRARFGDWEGDTVLGRANSGIIATHAERKSGYLVAIKLPSRHAKPLAEATIQAFKRLPKRWRRTLTYDNGSEFADFHRIGRATGLSIYFARPHAPWQRGCNENLNGLLRQFYRKNASLRDVTQSDLDKVVRLLNHRPRKRLGYLTPHEVLRKGLCVAVES
ncbi:IS30 family transposase [Salinisphaera sp. LB1]|uniref:IS30 family transposase n=1 Tax=Salinisphaera sp. LB1 TaxID=2183911 RepID=UPI000D7064E7|nr:Mobile element protein [Salinisphaera sp. LB1]